MASSNAILTPFTMPRPIAAFVGGANALILAPAQPMPTAAFCADGRGECRRSSLEHLDQRFSKISVQRAGRSSAKMRRSRHHAFYIEHTFNPYLLRQLYIRTRSDQKSFFRLSHRGKHDDTDDFAGFHLLECALF
ncbi:hypothetical protein GCT13_12590 [Paraburkholderia sp. CNPSo 3157]|uniref:Uncharacterized protein n=1 Tax=Paraburkholderia franconis TaxID=2654983 RepID=A0A7X1N9K1_9BURK|nr:hypothetical protein [Paraburkholderia franconis]MPW17749.1 hypothetical protein [Paraburkholderia franconis]